MPGVTARRAGLALVAVLNAAVLVHFHDRFWAAADDGHFTHVAERVLDGEVLNRDVETHHAGYVHFVNAAALATFGRTLVALRYPLVAAAFLQSLALYWLFSPHGVVLAAVAALSATALGVVQFLNPSSYWYSLALAVGLAAWLTRLPRGARLRVEGAGFLVGLMALFQQLPGAAAGCGVLAFLLLEADDPPAAGGRVLARATIGLLLAALGVYLWSLGDPAALLLFGTWPLAVLCRGWLVVRASDAATLRILRRLGAGVALAAAPLLVYHLAHGSLLAWLEDTIVRARRFPALTFIHLVSHRYWIEAGAELVRAPARFGDVLNGVYWIVLPFLAAANGVALLVRLRGSGARELPALPFLAVFYALVSLRYQIPVYLYYTAGLSLAGLLWLAADRSPTAARATAAGAAVLALVGLAYHAGEPIRSFEGMIRGERQPLAGAPGLPRLGLRIDPEDVAAYTAVVDLVRRETRPGEPIFVFPYDPEIYFLAERPNAFRFVLLPLHLTGTDDVERVIAGLDRTALVVHRADDKYNQPIAEPVLAAVRTRYERTARIGPFDVYRRR